MHSWCKIHTPHLHRCRFSKLATQARQNCTFKIISVSARHVLKWRAFLNLPGRCHGPHSEVISANWPANNWPDVLLGLKTAGRTKKGSL